MATPTPEEEIKALKAKIELQLKSNVLSAIQVANLTSAYNAVTNGVGALERYRDLLKSNQLIIDDIADGLDYVTKSFLADVAYLTKGKSLLNDHKSAITKLAHIAKETLDIRLGEQAIDEKRFKKLQENARKQIDNLKSVRDQYIIEGKSTDEIDAQIAATENLKIGFSEVSKVNEALNKQLGAAPKLVAGIDKAFQKLGLPDLGFNTALDETKQLGQEAASQGNEAFKKFSPMKTLIGKIGSNFKEMFTTANLLQAGIGFLIDALITADKGAGDLAKGFNMTYNEAMNVIEELTFIGNLSGDAALNTRALQESMMAVGKALGSNAMLNKEDLITFTKLREQAGFTNDELLGIEKTTLATGGNLEDNVSSLMHAAKVTGLNNKVLLNEKDIMRDVAAASDSIKLSLGGSGEKLGAAAAQAKALGMSLSQVDKIAGSLLNFEQSINDEISAELITGKDLNLEQARLYALTNDTEGLSRELAKNFGTAAEFGKMNRIQQEAIAAAVGMQRDELATTLTDQEALKGLSGDKLKDAQAALDYARASGMTEKQIADKSMDDLMKQQTVQERFNQSVEKLKEVFISIAEPVLQIVSPFVDLVTSILPAINFAFIPIAAVLGGIATTITYIVGSVSALIGFFTGANKQLSGMQIIVGAIAGFYLLIKGYQLASNVLAGISLGIEATRNNLGKQNLLLQNKGLIKSVGTAVSNTISAFSKLGPPGVVMGVIAAAAIVGMMAKYMGDGNFPAEGQGPDRTITSKGTMYKPAKEDNIYVTPQKMVAVGNASFKGNGGATNTSPNQFPQQSPQSAPTPMYFTINPTTLISGISDVQTQYYQTA